MDYYMRSVFGRKTCKVPVDGGFTCPNRDGSKGTGGCSFCSERGSGDFSAGREYSITRQIDIGAGMMRRKWKDAALIPYFQAFTNTYAPLDLLKARYSEALSHPDAAGICIATRPDCLSDETVQYLHSLAREHFVMLELGLQTIHDETARRFNRCYTFWEFLRGYEKVSDLFTCVHLINGLPGETPEMMTESAKVLGELAPKAVKLHLLHVLDGTPLAKDYLNGSYIPMERTEYINTVCNQLEWLPAETVIERVTGDGAEKSLLAPLWSIRKLTVQNDIDKELYARNSYQGIKRQIKKR